LAGFLCGAEPGVELFDALTARWNASTAAAAASALPRVPSNGEALSEARRDKFKMSERVRAAGLRAVRQALAAEWGEAEAFIKRLEAEQGRLAVILKPVRSSCA
jgi:biotin carboxylase